MRIAHLGPTSLPFNYPRGGAVQRRIRELAMEQASSGHQVTVVSAEARDSESLWQGVRVRGLACRFQGIRRDLEFLWRAGRSIRRGEFDVLHFHGLAEGAAFFPHRDFPLVLSYDYFKFRRGRETPLAHVYQKFLSIYQTVLPVSDYCRRESLTYWHLDPSRCITVHNGVNSRQFRPDPVLRGDMRGRLGLSEHDIVLLYVGRICAQKGTDLLLNAYRDLRRSDPRFRLVIAGPAAQFGNGTPDALSDRVAREALYAGALEEDELPAMYNACDLFLMPTREYEMFGMAAVEAQACGKPVVCSNHGGLPEVITPQSGAFFETGNASALTEVIRQTARRLHAEPKLPEAARRNGERFAWRRIALEIQSVYERACGQAAQNVATLQEI